MLHWISIVSLMATCLSGCLALPAAEEIFQSRSVVGDSRQDKIEGKLQIWIPYVGQGDSTLIIFPNGKNLLIDAGPPGAGKDYILPLLKKLKIESIDALIVTHYDLDHLGGIPEIPSGLDGIGGTSDDIRIIKTHDRGGEPWDSSPGYGAYLRSLEVNGIPRFELTAGDSILIDSNVKVHCVASNGVVGDGISELIAVDISPATFSEKENAASIGLLIEHGEFRYLTAGDLTGGGMLNGFLSPDVETALAEIVGRVDALHVNHHGSLSSSNESFVNLTSPRIVAIQAGKENPYGHPAQTVLERWGAVSSEIYSTADGHSILIEHDLMRGNSVVELDGH